MFGSGMTILITWNEEMNQIMKIVRFPKDIFLLIKVRETIKNEAKEQKDGFLGIFKLYQMLVY